MDIDTAFKTLARIWCFVYLIKESVNNELFK